MLRSVFFDFRCTKDPGFIFHHQNRNSKGWSHDITWFVPARQLVSIFVFSQLQKSWAPPSSTFEKDSTDKRLRWDFYFHLHDPHIVIYLYSTGDKITYLAREELVKNPTLKHLKRLNWMRNRIVHDYEIDELKNREEFFELYSKIISKLEWICYSCNSVIVQ